MKGFRPWLVRWAFRAGTRDFILPWLPFQPRTKYFFPSPHIFILCVPIAQQPGRQSRRVACLLIWLKSGCVWLVRPQRQEQNTFCHNKVHQHPCDKSDPNHDTSDTNPIRWERQALTVGTLLMRMRSSRICGWDQAECEWDLAECRWGLAVCGWDLAEFVDEI